MPRPLIGITCDAEPGGGWSRFPWLALRANYAAAVAEAGGLPVLLPHETDAVPGYAQVLDALIVSGGHFDVDPALYGAAERHPAVTTKDRRTAFELALLRAMLDADRPVLGICGGQQLLHVVLGGTLIQHIPDAVPGALPHERAGPPDAAAHAVRIHVGTRLHAIVGTEALAVNSTHHQAVDHVPAGVTVNATAPDGVIEGIEVSDRRFCLGVQWHPEFRIDDGDRRLFAAFVAAAGTARE